MKRSDERNERVDINEAARMTGLNPQTIYRLARQGRVRSFRVLSRSVRFDRTDLLALLSEKPSHPAGPETGI